MRVELKIKSGFYGEAFKKVEDDSTLVWGREVEVVDNVIKLGDAKKSIVSWLEDFPEAWYFPYADKDGDKNFKKDADGNYTLDGESIWGWINDINMEFYISDVETDALVFSVFASDGSSYKVYESVEAFKAAEGDIGVSDDGVVNIRPYNDAAVAAFS